MPRRKSFGDIENQLGRIQDRLGYSNDPVSRRRYQRALEARNRYSRNIQRTRSFQSLQNRYNGLLRQFNEDYANGRSVANLTRQIQGVVGEQLTRQYSQRTYMGLNNG